MVPAYLWKESWIAVNKSEGKPCRIKGRTKTFSKTFALI
jgi:hypothetical protein